MDATPPQRPPEPNPYEPPHAPTGRPVTRRSAAVTVLGTVVGVGTVALASVIAFVVTCFPLGFAAFGVADGGRWWSGFVLAMPWLIGLACGIGTGVASYRLFFRSRHRELPPPTNEVPGP